MSQIAQRVSGFGTTIFTEMTNLAIKHKAVNLGQGFPDFAAPDFVKQSAVNAINADLNQYPPANGRPRLRQALADKMAKHYGMRVNPDNEIIVMQGATECIMATMMGLINQGDEVILLEPYFDSYVPAVQFAGGIPRYYTLRAPDWAIDPEQLAALFNDKTRMIVINTPHNPTGKVFSRAEQQMIADLCQKWDVLCVEDGVYEHITFDGATHQPMATLDGMADRTITISSLGKTFSVTGWKVGWTMASPELTTGIFRAHQFTTFTGAGPLQEAAADALILAEENGYYEEMGTMYVQKRDKLIGALKSADLRPLIPQGTYFVMIDISDLGFANDIAFCQHLVTEVGVVAIPPSAFYSNPADGAGVARFTFCKTDKLLDAAAERLGKMRI